LRLEVLQRSLHPEPVVPVQEHQLLPAEEVL